VGALNDRAVPGTGQAVTLSAGSKLGPYEILGQIGAGGMGEVYRGRDSRLGREVAIKILPASFSTDTDRLRRFEQEAKAAGMLNHPNITAVYDIGAVDGAPYVVQELLEGETLRSALAGGKLSTRRATDYAMQIAQGLAAAHDKGIVHRDLKPENVFITKDGRVKILDFGLAKLTHQEEGSQVTNVPTATAGTEPGVVLGTLGYMSPEQVRGKPADARSDIFSFGAILYEMLSGNRAFRGDSAADTMSAILKEDPPDLSVTNQNISPGLERIVHHCLEKNPEQRFHSAHDVAFALEAISGASAPGAVPLAAVRPMRRRSAWIAAALAGVVAGVLIGALARPGLSGPGQPTFKRLTYRRGTVWTARFAPDGQTVVYSAAWERNPIDVYMTRPESPESRPFGLKDASLFGVSPTGDLAVMLGARTASRSYERFGTLARIPLAGGSPRPILDDVRYADWGPDGKELMVERTVAGRHRIEFPIGKVVYESAERIDTPRLSPDGRSVAFFEGSLSGGIALRLVENGGAARTLARLADWWNLAWSPDGREIWYAAPEPGSPPGISSLQAISPSGKRRLLLRVPGLLELHDVARNGRVLFSQVRNRIQLDGVVPGESSLRELSWLDASSAEDVTPDGKTILIVESGEGAGPNQTIYVRGTDGSAATPIGEGTGSSLSPDGRFVVSSVPNNPGKLTLLPTGSGSPRTLEFEGLQSVAGGVFLPDGKRLVIEAKGQSPQVYVAPFEGGKPRPITPSGWKLTPFGNPVSPDGRLVVVMNGDGKSSLVPIEGGDPAPIPGLADGEFPIQWTADGRAVYTHRGGGLPARIWRLEIATGRKELFRELSPMDAIGVTSVEKIVMTPDGRGIFYSYRHNLSDLYVADGLK